MSKNLYNECLLNYNDYIENNIEFEIDNFLFNYKDKNNKIKDILSVVEENIDNEEYHKTLNLKLCSKMNCFEKFKLC